MILSCWIIFRKRNVSDKDVETIETHFVFNNLFFLIVPFIKWGWKFVEPKCATNGDIIRWMGTAGWIINVTNTHSEHIMLLAFHYTNNYTNASPCYVIRPLPLLCAFLVLPVRAAVIPSTSYVEYPLFELLSPVLQLRLEKVEVAFSITFDTLLFSVEDKICIPAQ